MGMVRTDTWLEEDFAHPIKICDKLIPVFKGQDAAEIYHELQNFGMYKPSKATREIFLSMKKNNFWEKIDVLYHKYLKKWNGPDVPVYLFPISKQSGLFIRNAEKIKGGVSFPDKMFLFLSDNIPLKEVEALLVHEYHHVCRLNKYKKSFEEYTLMDSIIIEGLAEYAVLVHCGREYLASWCNMYSESEIAELWDKFLQKHLEIKKTDREHDELLYGLRKFPKLLGYAAGYKIVKEYYNNNYYSSKLSFILPADYYIKNIINLKKKSR